MDCSIDIKSGLNAFVEFPPEESNKLIEDPNMECRFQLNSSSFSKREKDLTRLLFDVQKYQNRLSAIESSAIESKFQELKTLSDSDYEINDTFCMEPGFNFKLPFLQNNENELKLQIIVPIFLGISQKFLE